MKTALVVGNHPCAMREIKELSSLYRWDAVVAINGSAVWLDMDIHCLATHHRELVPEWKSNRISRLGRDDLHQHNIFTVNGSKISTSQNQYRICLEKSGSSSLFGALYACHKFDRVVVTGARLDGDYRQFRDGWVEAYEKNLYQIRDKCRAYVGSQFGYVSFIKHLLGGV
jgi:hypothetical protein